MSASEPPNPSHTDESATKTAASTCRDVLVVDDDPAMLRLLSRVLEKAGYEVRTANDGAEAVSQIEQACPDFVITDWEMPQMDGLELCRRLRAAQLPKYVFIFMLTGKWSADVITSLESGANDFLNKPVVPAELVARLRSGQRVLELERRLSHLAHHDALTGLPTRRGFFDVLQREFERSRRHGHALSCVMLDVDFFKRINDFHGHPMGDVVLQQLAALLEKSCRATDVVSRFGGEEFCILLPDTNEPCAILWADRVCRGVRSHTFGRDGRSLRATVSLGVTQLREDTISTERLIDEADQALLVAKQSGRDRVVSFAAMADGSHHAQNPLQKDPLDGVLARDCMTAPVACLNQCDTVELAADFFDRVRITSAPVVDNQGRLVGILSEKDVLASILQDDAWHVPIKELMQTNVVTFDEDAPVRKIYQFLCRVTIRRVIIIKHGCPAGVIDRGGLLRWMHNVAGTRQPLDYRDKGTQGRPVQEPIAETARALVAEALELNTSLSERLVNPTPAVVGRVSRMQELLNDLLAYSRLFQHASGHSGDHLRL